jgi:hypothetical protein
MGKNSPIPPPIRRRDVLPLATNALSAPYVFLSTNAPAAPYDFLATNAHEATRFIVLALIQQKRRHRLQVKNLQMLPSASNTVTPA